MTDTRTYVVRRAIGPRTCARIIEANRRQVGWVRPRSGGSIQAHPISRIGDLDGAAYVMGRAFHRANRELGWRIPLEHTRWGCTLYVLGDYMLEHVDDEERDEPPWDLPHRGISISLQLSPADSYEGGDLRLRVDETYEWSVAPRGQGDLIAFGSSTPHDVTPVESGERWVALGWSYCNHNRRRLR